MCEKPGIMRQQTPTTPMPCRTCCKRSALEKLWPLGPTRVPIESAAATWPRKSIFFPPNVTFVGLNLTAVSCRVVKKKLLSCKRWSSLVPEWISRSLVIKQESETDVSETSVWLTTCRRIQRLQELLRIRKNHKEFIFDCSGRATSRNRRCSYPTRLNPSHSRNNGMCSPRLVTERHHGPNSCADVGNRRYLTYLLHGASRVVLEKLTGFAAIKKFPAFYGTRKFITVLTSARHLSLSWANPIQSSQPLPTSSRSILILSSHLSLGLPNGSFPQVSPPKPCAHLSLPPHVVYTVQNLRWSAGFFSST